MADGTELRIKVNRGDMVIDIMELVRSMGPKERADVARFLCAEEYLFKAALEYVATGSYFSDDADGDWSFNRESLAEMRERLVPLMPDVIQGLVEELVRQRDQAKALEKRANDWAWALWHAFPEYGWKQRPEPPRDFPSVWTDASAAKKLIDEATKEPVSP